MNEISFTVNGKNLKAEENYILTSGSCNSDKCVFNFDSQWNSFTKQIVFLNSDDEEFSDYIVDDSIVIPEEVLRNAGLLKIGVVGLNSDGIIISTNFVALKIITGANESETIPTADAELIKNGRGGGNL